MAGKPQQDWSKFTDQQFLDAHTEGGGWTGAAQILGLKLAAMSSYLRAHRPHLIEAVKRGGAQDQSLGRIAELLKNSGIDPADIGRVEKVRLNEWQGLVKDDNGDAQVIDMSGASVILTPSWETGPAWPVVQPAPPQVIRPLKASKPSRAEKLAVILPDPQIGYRRDDETGELDPFHDEQAISLAMQVVRDLQPDKVVNIGDTLDLQELSRFVPEAAFARTTQPSVIYGAEYFARQRANAPDAEIVAMEGNHCLRIATWVRSNAMWAFGLRPGQEPPSTWPMLTIPRLLGFDDLGVNYVEGYPAGAYWVNDRLKVVHGSKTGKRGTVANKVAADEQVSTLTGHTHGLEMVYHTVDTRTGPRTRLAGTCGCLCRIDGAVPSTKGGIDAFGRPVVHYEDWQQAVVLVSYREGDAPFAVEPVMIHEGEAIVRGKHYTADVPALAVAA